MTVSVIIESLEEKGPGAYYCTITTDNFEVNVDLVEEELEHLEHLESFDWDSRKSQRIGTVVGQPAWWCASYKDKAAPMFSILVGEDDEVWQIALVLPPLAISMLREQVRACRK